MREPQLEALYAGAKAVGIAQVGVCSPREDLKNQGCRSRKLPEDTKSLLLCLFPYYVGDYPYRNLSRYAMVPDYHRVVEQRLLELAALLERQFPGGSFTPFCDQSPLLEVKAAARAGLGVIGRHTQLINPRFGSYLFIGSLASNVTFPATGSGRTELCDGCGACIAACPEGALGDEGLCQARCRSFLTQKKRLTEVEAQRVAAGPLVWGCDCCLSACPHNRSPQFSPEGLFYKSIQPVVRQESLEIDFASRAFAYKGADILKRNLLLMAGLSEQETDR